VGAPKASLSGSFYQTKEFEMKIKIMMALALIGFTPSLAQAHTTRGELRRDVRDVREERREFYHALRYGSRHDIREERGEYRDAKRELREDVRDWRRQR
jgi:hypothetical protein